MLRVRSSTVGGVDVEPPLGRLELGTYLDLVEIVARLRYAVELQLRDAGDLSYVQFQLLAALGDAPEGRLGMTELADGVVYSRSGLTYQAQLLERAGLVDRGPAEDDGRGVRLTITDAGRAVLARVLPGHVATVGRLLFAPLSRTQLEELAGLLAPLREHMRAVPPRSAAPRRTR